MWARAVRYSYTEHAAKHPWIYGHFSQCISCVGQYCVSPGGSSAAHAGRSATACEMRRTTTTTTSVIVVIIIIIIISSSSSQSWWMTTS